MGGLSVRACRWSTCTRTSVTLLCVRPWRWSTCTRTSVTLLSVRAARACALFMSTTSIVHAQVHTQQVRAQQVRVFVLVTQFVLTRDLLPTAYEVWRRVLFLQTCVTHSVHGGGRGRWLVRRLVLGQGGGGLVGGRGKVPGWGVVVWSGGRYLARGFLPSRPGRQGRPPPPRPPLYARILSFGGRYASYWNALLLHVHVYHDQHSIKYIRLNFYETIKRLLNFGCPGNSISIIINDS